MSGLTVLGNPSKTVWLTREADRTAIEFIAGTAADLKKGQPVKLDDDGTVLLWAVADGIQKLIGYCMSDAVDGDFVTITTRGLGVVYAIATTGGVDAGLGNYLSYDTSAEVDTSSGQATTTGYMVYGNTDDGDMATDANGWILEPADEDELIRVLLMN